MYRVTAIFVKVRCCSYHCCLQRTEQISPSLLLFKIAFYSTSLSSTATSGGLSSVKRRKKPGRLLTISSKYEVVKEQFFHLWSPCQWQASCSIFCQVLQLVVYHENSIHKCCHFTEFVNHYSNYLNFKMFLEFRLWSAWESTLYWRIQSTDTKGNI